MANASVEKLKALGIRHGEKAVVGLTATLFVVFTALAVVKPTLEMKPEELGSAADSAQSNLQKPQDPKDILARLEKDGLKDPNFVQVVENQLNNALKPGDYRPRIDWVTPEPGAGLIRDQPELIAPTELAAFPGRGGILMYALENGERVIETPEEAKKKEGSRRRRRPGGMSGMPGMGGSAMGPGGANRPPDDDSPEAKKRREREEAQRKLMFAGKADATKEKDKAKDQPEVDPATQGPWKEETKGKRWVVITGVLDNEKLKKNYLLALKSEALAYPNYKRLDVERQSRQSDGSWTDWAAVDQNKNWEVLDNLPESDTEYVPETQRPPALVDQLPFLHAGYWTGVHVARLVPREVLEPPKTAAAPAGMRGGYPGMGMPGMGVDGGAPGGSAMGGSGSRGGKFGAGGMMPGMSMGAPSGMPGGSAGMAGMAGMAGGQGGSGPNPEEINFTKYEDATLMVRSLDFTVEPDTTYRYRLRIVVVNPNKDHTDVNPGVDTESKNLVGPWSEPTESVGIPADVAAYAQAPETVPRRDDLISFQVVRWDPGTGQTVIKNDVAGPGDIVGEYGSVPMPSSEGSGPKSAQIEFNSRAIVLDSFGGRQRLPDIGVERNQFEVPAVAMIVEPDGSVVIRSQARDRSDEVRKDMETNYKQAIEDSGKARDSGAGGSRVPGSSGAPRSNRRRGNKMGR